MLYGYRQMHPIFLMVFGLLTLLTMFTTIAAVTVVTASILANMLPVSGSIALFSLIILLACGLILALGKYHLLDSVGKYIILLLSVSTVIALVAIVLKIIQI